jgi:glycogen debranching enzyme
VRAELLARPTERFTHSGRSIFITDPHGAVTGARSEGLWVDDTRLLSRLEWRIDGAELRPAGAGVVGRDVFASYLAVPDANRTRPGDVYLQVVHVVGDGMRTRVRIDNYGLQPRRLELALHLAADFADLEEAERGERLQDGAVETVWDDAELRLTFRYLHPRLRLASHVTVEATPVAPRWEDGALRFALDTAPRETLELELVHVPEPRSAAQSEPPRRALDVPSTRLERLRDELRREMPALYTTNATVARAWDTATADLAALPYGLDGAPAAPAAGLPIYVEFFGRDALTIGWQALLTTPRLVRDALVANAAFQGRVIDDWRDEEPGKMIHRAGGGPLSQLGHDPFDRYYGDWATGPDFLVMLGQYLAWTGDAATLRRLTPAARATLDWLERYGDIDHDGFLEYDTRSPRGDKNQGWKDSADAVMDEHGAIPDNPIATSEIQAYWYAGLQHAAAAFAVCGDFGLASELLASARRLRRRFNAAFWMEELDFYAMALGPDKRQLRSISSNTGHLLASGIVTRERAARVAARLMQADLFSGWGIRTLSSEHPRYHPFSYHLGSVWPVEQGTIALGLARYGLWDELHRLARAVFESTDLFVANRLPEAIGGLPRDADHPHPGVYPNSCEPQGWSASAIVLIVQSILGMVPIAPLGILVIDPHLPAWLPDLRLEGVRVGGSVLDLEFRRDRRGRTRYSVNRRVGRVRVLRQPPPQARVPLASRLLAATGSVVRS